jgi:hypothetical protein
VIRNADEMVLSIVGKVVPSQQEEVLSIYEGVPPPPRSDPSLQAVISEGPHGRGISLETGRGHPLAFLDTWEAFRAGQRRVHVYHPPPSLGTGDRNATALLFGAMEVCEPGQFVIRRSSEGAALGVTVLRVLAKSGSHNFVDARGGLLAATDRPAGPDRPYLVLRLTRGADAGLILCALMASIKLS